MNFVDRNGKDGYYFYDSDMFPTLDTEAIMEMDVEYLEEKYNTEIHVIAMDTEKNPYGFMVALLIVRDEIPPVPILFIGYDFWKLINLELLVLGRMRIIKDPLL